MTEDAKTAHSSQEQAQEETIKLDQFLKLAHIVQSGGEAKHLIKLGFVMVNGEVEKRRGRKLRDGDMVEVEGDQLVVQITDE